MMRGAYATPASGYLCLWPPLLLGGDLPTALHRVGITAEHLPVAKAAGWALAPLAPDGGVLPGAAFRVAVAGGAAARQQAATVATRGPVLICRAVARGTAVLWEAVERVTVCAAGEALAGARLIAPGGVLLEKALNPKFAADMNQIAARLATTVHGLDRKLALPLIRQALERFDYNWPKLSAGQLNQAINAVRESLHAAALAAGGKLLPEWSHTMRMGLTTVADGTRKAVKDYYYPRVGLSLSQPDQQAIAQIGNQAGVFLRDQTGARSARVTAAGTRLIREGLRQGLGREAIATSLMKNVPDLWSQYGRNYARTVAAVAVHRARSFSEVSGYKEAGIHMLEVQAVLDERTTDICRTMDGQMISVDGCYQHAVAAASVPSPEDIYKVAPFMRTQRDRQTGERLVTMPNGTEIARISRSGLGAVDDRGDFKMKVGGNALLSQGVGLPPYHFQCRTTTVPRVTMVQVPRGKMPVAEPEPVTPPTKVRPPLSPLSVLGIGEGAAASVTAAPVQRPLAFVQQPSAAHPVAMPTAPTVAGVPPIPPSQPGQSGGPASVWQALDQIEAEMVAFGNKLVGTTWEEVAFEHFAANSIMRAHGYAKGGAIFWETTLNRQAARELEAALATHRKKSGGYGIPPKPAVPLARPAQGGVVAPPPTPSLSKLVQETADDLLDAGYKVAALPHKMEVKNGALHLTYKVKGKPPFKTQMVKLSAAELRTVEEELAALARPLTRTATPALTAPAEAAPALSLPVTPTADAELRVVLDRMWDWHGPLRNVTMQVERISATQDRVVFRGVTLKGKPVEDFRHLIEGRVDLAQIRRELDASGGKLRALAEGEDSISFSFFAKQAQRAVARKLDVPPEHVVVDGFSMQEAQVGRHTEIVPHATYRTIHSDKLARMSLPSSDFAHVKGLVERGAGRRTDPWLLAPTPVPVAPPGVLPATVVDTAKTYGALRGPQGGTSIRAMRENADDWSAVISKKKYEGTFGKVQDSIQQELENDPAFWEMVRVRANRTKDDWAAMSDAAKARASKDVMTNIREHWNVTSAGTSVDAHALQLAIREEFGLAAASTEHLSKAAIEGVYARYSDESLLGLRRYLRKMYQETQRQLAEIGEERLLLYRGQSLPADGAPPGLMLDSVNRVADVAMQPASSYSANFDTAHSFTGMDDISMLIEASVPRERVLAFGSTGLGTEFEAEMVVLGGEGRVNVVAWKERDGRTSEEVQAAFGLPAQKGPVAAAEGRKKVGKADEIPPTAIRTDVLPGGADWLRGAVWHYPPYKGAEFMALLGTAGMDLEEFRGTVAYRGAVARGEIADDVWTGRTESWNEPGLLPGVPLERQVERRVTDMVARVRSKVALAQQDLGRNLYAAEIAAVIREMAGPPADNAAALTLGDAPAPDGGRPVPAARAYREALAWAAPPLVRALAAVAAPPVYQLRGVQASYQPALNRIVVPDGASGSYGIIHAVQHWVDTVGATGRAALYLRNSRALPGPLRVLHPGEFALEGPWIDPYDGRLYATTEATAEDALVRRPLTGGEIVARYGARRKASAPVPATELLSQMALRLRPGHDLDLSLAWETWPEQVGLYLAAMRGAFVPREPEV